MIKAKYHRKFIIIHHDYSQFPNVVNTVNILGNVVDLFTFKLLYISMPLLRLVKD